MAEGGIIGFLIFAGWILWYLRRSYLFAKESDTGFVLLQTWLVFGLTSLTQNAFQDSEVQYTLVLLMCASLYLLSNKEQPVLAAQAN